MRKSTIAAAILLIAVAVLLALTSPAQSYKMINGKIETVSKKEKKVKTGDQVYQVVGNDTIFQGAKGGLYYYKVSKKTGLKYKCYIKTK